MTPRCEKHRVKLKWDSRRKEWHCPYSHTPIKKPYIPPKPTCPNCGKEMETPFQHFRGCM